MTSKTVTVEIKGISPLLMHAFPMVKIEALEKKSPEEQAEFVAYRDPETKGLFVPGMAVQRMLVGGASFSKGKGRATLSKIVAACVFITPDRIPLNQKKYEIDARPVVVPATKGRVLRYRPRLDAWALKFSLEFDPDLLTEAQIRRVVDDSGSRVGLLDFRPERKGSFGRFVLTSWDS